MRASWWWIDRWRSSPAYTGMSLAEQGAYRNLLDELWVRDGLLPKDERVLARACGDPLEWAAVREIVLAQFTETEDGYRHDTHDQVMSESKRRAQKQKDYRDRKKEEREAREAKRSGNVAGNVAPNVGRSPDPSSLPSEENPPLAPPSGGEENDSPPAPPPDPPSGPGGERLTPERLADLHAECAPRLAQPPRPLGPALRSALSRAIRGSPDEAYWRQLLAAAARAFPNGKRPSGKGKVDLKWLVSKSARGQLEAGAFDAPPPAPVRGSNEWRPPDTSDKATDEELAKRLAEVRERFRAGAPRGNVLRMAGGSG